jgi:hypothetical protein
MQNDGLQVTTSPIIDAAQKVVNKPTAAQPPETEERPRFSSRNGARRPRTAPRLSTEKINLDTHTHNTEVSQKVRKQLKSHYLKYR